MKSNAGVLVAVFIRNGWVRYSSWIWHGGIKLSVKIYIQSIQVREPEAVVFSVAPCFNRETNQTVRNSDAI